MRRALPIAALLVALALPGRAAAITKADLSLTMSDGVSIAATMYLPDGPTPAAGWPAIVALHGLGGNRTTSNAIAEANFVPRGYSVLTYDARGHGESGGLVTIDGPREIEDLRALFGWLAARPDVADGRIGGWGISYGGGALLRGVAERVPFAALAVVQAWTELYSALMPHDLAKSGVIAGFAASIRPDAMSPLVRQIRDDAFAGRNLAAIRAFARERSSRHLLTGVRTPVYFFQGRRDFAFGMEQAIDGFRRVAGPRRLYIGAFGHAPSRFPGADAATVFGEGLAWFDRWLAGTRTGMDAGPAVKLAADPFRGSVAGLPSTPPTDRLLFSLGGTQTIAPTGRVVHAAGRTSTLLETFGAPVLLVRATASGGWSRLVATLTATPPGGSEVVVSAGGTRTRPGTREYRISLISQATTIPRGSQLRLVVAGDTTKQHPDNLLYLDLPMPRGARVTVGNATLALPVLRRPVSR